MNMCKVTKVQDQAGSSPILKVPCPIPYPRTTFSSTFSQNSLPKMANRPRVRNHQQIGGTIIYYHVQYYPFQPSEVPGTLRAWLSGQDLAIANVRADLSYSCDHQEGCASLAWREQGLFRHRKLNFQPNSVSSCSQSKHNHEDNNAGQEPQAQFSFKRLHSG